MMFYDEIFQNVLENGPFSQEATLVIENTEYLIKGIFCSGNYGMNEYDKGYSTKKTEKRQSFKISLASIPQGLSESDLIRQSLTVNGKAWVINGITGNESGVLELSLKAAS